MTPNRYHAWALVALALIGLPGLYPESEAVEPVAPYAAAALDDRIMLPVHSPRLSPGPVTPRALQLPGPLRLFLVGDDPLSLAWLQARAAQLQQLRAVGLVVEVADAAGLARLRAAVPGLTLLPISGEDLARRLDVTHYPVLITATVLEQ